MCFSRLHSGTVAAIRGSDLSLGHPSHARDLFGELFNVVNSAEEDASDAARRGRTESVCVVVVVDLKTRCYDSLLEGVLFVFVSCVFLLAYSSASDFSSLHLRGRHWYPTAALTPLSVTLRYR